MAVIVIRDPETFQREYPRVRDWLLAALKHNTNALTERDMLDGIDEGIYQLWTSENAACLSSIIDNWNGKRICCLILIGGESGRALEDVFVRGMPVLTDFAQSHNCEGLLGIGRVGWSRIASRYGFKVLNGNNFYKEVSDGKHPRTTEDGNGSVEFLQAVL